MAQSEWKKKWSAEYNARPDVKEKKRLYAALAENKLKEKLRKQKYSQRPEVKERNRLLRKQPHRVAQRAEYEKTEGAKQSRRLATKKYKEKNPDKVKAWAKVSNAKRKQDPEFQAKQKEYEKKRYQNPEYREKRKEYVKENEARIREYRKQYALENKERLAQKRKQRRVRDNHYKLKTALRSRLANAVRRNQKFDKTLNLLGCGIDYLKTHLESQFVDGMCWENWSRTGWHIDHIVPFGQFDLSDPVQQIAVCNWRNLRPLWAKKNHEKRDKLTEDGIALKGQLLTLAKDIYDQKNEA